MPKARTLSSFKRGEISPLFLRSRFILKRQNVVFRAASVAPAGEGGRVLIVIPRTYGSAPVRNLLRRRVKALFYEQGWYARGYDWIFSINRKEGGAWHPIFAELVALWEEAWERLSELSQSS